MKRVLIFAVFLFFSNEAGAGGSKGGYNLAELIQFTLNNNPGITAAASDISGAGYGIEMAKGEMRPKIDFRGGVTEYRYAVPITPITGSPLAGSPFPEFDNTIYDAGVSLTLPLYVGGRLDRGLTIARIKKEIAEDRFLMSKQELIYNVTAVYYKIAQLEKLLELREAAVKQLESHKRNAELFLEAGTIPRVELLKVETELAHTRQSVISVKNSMESTYEILKVLMGMDDLDARPSIIYAPQPDYKYPVVAEESVTVALSQRPDYRVASRRVNMASESVRLVNGKWLPSVFLSGDYSERSGDRLEFKDNWSLGLRLSVPLFEGGIIKAEEGRERMQVDKAREEERAVRMEITREVKEAYLNIDSATKRIEVAKVALDAARESMRIENLKYENGSGTSTDVIDAQTLLLRAETDYQQAVYDKEIAVASLRRSMGEDIHEMPGVESQASERKGEVTR